MFHQKSKRVFWSERKKNRKNRLVIVFILILALMIVFLIYLNNKLMPTYLDYAKVQTQKIASHVVSKAINARTTDVLDVNDIIVSSENENDMVTIRFNTEVINRVRAETATLVKQFLEQAENGDLSTLPDLEYVEYDVGEMQAGDGIVFFVPLGQAANLPIIGNLGPKIPIRFHIIGNVATTVEKEVMEFGINNAYVEVAVHIEVNVQIIVPFASSSAKVQQTIPVAMGIVRGHVPQIYTTGDSGAQPSIEVPIKNEDD